jgi:hypothetical protein
MAQVNNGTEHRIPDVDLERVEFTKSEPAISGNDLNFTVKYPLLLKIKVTNPNYYSIKTNTILINACISPNLTILSKTKFPGSLLTGKVDDYRIGRSISKNVNFAQGETTSISAILQIEYTPNPKYGALNDPSLGEVLRICSSQGRKSKETMKIVNYIDIDIGILSTFGYKPRIVRDLNIQCPISSVALEQLSVLGVVDI